MGVIDLPLPKEELASVGIVEIPLKLLTKSAALKIAKWLTGL